MKRLLAILILFTCTSEVNAQSATHDALYLSTELCLGNYTGIDFNFNYIHNEKYSFKLGFSGYLREARSQPDDYSGGLMSLFSFGLINPYEEMVTYQFAFGRIFMLNKNETIRLNAALGIGYTEISVPHNWQRINAFFLPNYGWEWKEYSCVSIIINPKIEFPFTRVFGLSVSPMMQINKYRTYAGIGIGCMLGVLKKKIPFQ